MSNFYFFYQTEDEGPWHVDGADNREAILASKNPVFTTVLDLTVPPDDNDFSSVAYRGPMYFDFDAGNDIQRACEGVKDFVARLSAEYNVEPETLYLYVSGGKGFHVEIPPQAWQFKVNNNGFTHLPYIFREVANKLSTDTMDFAVYTGKKGRMWRTPNVKRSNGKYKVPVTLDELMQINADNYDSWCSAPRPQPARKPSIPCGALVMEFDRARENVLKAWKGRKDKRRKSAAQLEAWKSAKKNPPTIEAIMNGELLKDGVGFQAVAMQLAIYASSMEMSMDDFLKQCEPLCEKHVSDSYRYNSFTKRQNELRRMYYYMNDSPMYDFDAGPIINMLQKDYIATDLGAIDKDVRDDVAPEEAIGDAGTDAVDDEDINKGVRAGFFMNSHGMYRSHNDSTVTVSRAVFRNPTKFYEADGVTQMGFEADLIVNGVSRGRKMVALDTLSSIAKMRAFMTANAIAFQGSDGDAQALMDILEHKASARKPIYVFPREGLGVIFHPTLPQRQPVMYYLTADTYVSQYPEDHQDYFYLRYKPSGATSAYRTDIHKSPDLTPDMAPEIDDLFKFNRPDVVANLLGWFVSSHYRSVYLHLFSQHPLLQVFGEAGSGKTQTVLLMSHLHWYKNEIRLGSAMGGTTFALDQRASSSTSVPMILDEYKPRELKKRMGQYEKIKDLLKNTYVGGEVGERGTVNKGAESSLSLISAKALAPLIFMGEAAEMETAIMERCVHVSITQAYQTDDRRNAFYRLRDNPVAISALGKAVMQAGFSIDFDKFKADVRRLMGEVERHPPPGMNKRESERPIYNKAVVLHGLEILKAVLGRVFGDRYDSVIDELIELRLASNSEADVAMREHGMSEISKVMDRLSQMSKDIDMPHELRLGKDYIHGGNWVELNVARAYDQYRRYCVSVRDVPLFDTLDAFKLAVASYSPVTDRSCVASELRGDTADDYIVRLDVKQMNILGVHQFRS